MKKSPIPLAVIALVAALSIAGCGGDGDDASSGAGGNGQGSAAANEPPASGRPTIVSSASVSELGEVIVDSEGFTLYDFHKDTGGSPSCYDACAETWPPLLADGDLQASEGAEESQLGIVNRTDGTVQVTYAGYPVYTYTGDEEAGEANGHDIDSFGAEWYALQPSGKEAEG